MFSLKKKGGQFECIYFDTQYNYHALIAKYSDLIQKQYNYDKDLVESFENNNCKVTVGLTTCDLTNGKVRSSVSAPSTCNKLYVGDYNKQIGITNKDISDRFLTSLILSLFICLANIGLAIFGFLLFRTPEF